MNRAFSMPGAEAEQSGAATIPRAGPRARMWTFSQIMLFTFVFLVFSLSGNPQLGILEDLTGYLFLVTVVIESIRRGTIDVRIPIELKFAIGFALVLLFSLCIEGLIVDSNLAAFKLNRYFNFLQVTVVGFLVMAVLVRYKDLRPLEFAMYAGVIYNAVLMFSDLLLGANLARAGGGIGQANEMAVALAMAAALAFARLVLLLIDKTQSSRLNLLLVCGCLSIQALTVYMNFTWTGSRTGMVLCSLILTLSLGFMCYGAAHGKRGMLLAIFGVIVALPFVLQSLSETTFIDRLSNVYLFFSGKELAVQETSIHGRTEMILAGLDLWSQRPIFGWGFDAFQYVSGYGFYSHSNHVELLVNQGIVGYGAYLSIFIVAMVNSVRVTRQTKNRLALITMLYALIGVLLAAGFSSVIYYKKSHWIMLGLIAALNVILPDLTRSRSDSHRPP